MFSAEFTAFSRGTFGTGPTRREVDAIAGLYRGLLAQLPASAGFALWLQRLRGAQCQGAASVVAEADAMSAQFTQGAEYAARNRSHAQYVSDLYDALLQRGADTGGINFWVDEISTGKRTREKVRQDFVASAEFHARVDAINAQGCWQ